MPEQIGPEAERVLSSLAEADRADPGGNLPLREIAKRVLGGNAEMAVRALGELDLAGLVRTDIMGWHFGRLTARGRKEAQGPEA